MRKLRKFSCCAISRSSVAISPVAPNTSCSACRTSSSDVTPPRSRTCASCSDSCRDSSVRLRDVQFEIERPQSEVRARHLADERRHDGAASPLGREQLRACALGGAAELAPEIQLPRRRTPESGSRRCSATESRAPPTAAGRDVDAGADVREFIGVGDAELRLRLENPHRGDPQIVVVLERRANQILQHVVIEQLRPLLVGDRRRGWRRRVVAAERVRLRDRRTFVVRTDEASQTR
mgnify:CR=1 FL=1